ncbi:hypothetical protein OAC62_05920 [Amylibacter sp.]|nr:hypothetical protein [Amylibacter sp.]
MTLSYSLRTQDVKIAVIIAIIYFFVIKYLHLNLYNILLFCNDDFFDSDTAEIYTQISGFYLNTDTMKHFVPYLVLFLFEKIRYILDPGAVILTKVSIFQLIAATNVALIFLVSKAITNENKKAYLSTLVFASTFSQLTVGSFPETYGASILLLLSYLLFYLSSAATNKEKDIYIRIAGSSILGLSHLPLFIIGLYSKFENHSPSDIRKSLIVVISGGLIGTSPMWSVSLMSASSFELIYTYTDRYASFAHLTDRELWLTVVSNLFIVATISPSEIILNKYNVDDIPLYYWVIFFIIICMSVLRGVKASSAQVKLIITSSLILLFQITFYVFFAPEFSALYGLTTITILLFFLTLLGRNISLRKGVYFILLLVPLIIVSQNIHTILSTPNIPTDGGCNNWGVKNGLYRVF